MEDFLAGMLRIRASPPSARKQHFPVVTAAPGLEVSTLVRIAEWEDERIGSRRRHVTDDDAPATGHSVPLLATPGTLLKMLPFGPLTSTARDLALLLGDPKRAAVTVVTRAEEMAVNETLELATDLMRIGVTLLPVVVNAVDPFRFTRAEAQRVRAEPADVPASWQPYLGVARFSVARQRAAERQIRRLTHALPDRPVCLPQVAAGHHLAALEPLADALAPHPPRRSRDERAQAPEAVLSPSDAACRRLAADRRGAPSARPEHRWSASQRGREDHDGGSARDRRGEPGPGIRRSSPSTRLTSARRLGSRLTASRTRPLGAATSPAVRSARSTVVLDTKRTFDELIQRYAPPRRGRVDQPDLRESRRLAGSQGVHGDGAPHALAAHALRPRWSTRRPQHALIFSRRPSALTSRAAILQNRA
jgi:hypothetical protein